MKRIAVLVCEESIVSAVTGILDVFEEINEYLRGAGAGPEFIVSLIGQDSRTIRLQRMQFDCHATVKDIGDVDLILVPPTKRPTMEFIEGHRKAISWIRDSYFRGQTEVASLCTGAFLLGASGILNGKSCSTHWAAADYFRQMFPEVKLASDKVITDEDGIYTSGGASSFYNLLLYLVEKYCGKEAAVFGAKMMLVDMDRGSLQHFTIFESQKNHNDQSIIDAQEFIEQNFSREIALDEIASHVRLSRRSLIRRFKSATHNTPYQYLQRVRIEAAKKSLETTGQTVSEVMYDTGYSDMKSFRQLFKKLTGLTPGAYRKKYSFATG